MFIGLALPSLNSTSDTTTMDRPMQTPRKSLVFRKVRSGPSGLHIFDRTTGLNVLLDEVKVPEAFWSRAPRHISVALTNACELSCPYCYAPKKPAALNFNRLAEWLTELDDHGCLGVGFGGGEPTLHPRFADICQYAAKSTGLAVTFTTHGHTLNDHLLDTLKGNVNFVRVSMDGVGATYETLRSRSFPSLVNRIKQAGELAPFGINYVVNRRTVVDLDAAIDLAIDTRAAELLLLPEQPVNGHGGIDDATAKTLRGWIGRYRGPIPITMSEAGVDGITVADPFAGEHSQRSHAHIDAQGILKRTSFDNEGQAIDEGGVIRALGRLGALPGEKQR